MGVLFSFFHLLFSSLFLRKENRRKKKIAEKTGWKKQDTHKFINQKVDSFFLVRKTLALRKNGYLCPGKIAAESCRALVASVRCERVLCHILEGGYG